MQTHKEIVINFETLIIAGKVREAYDAYVSPDFFHHNPYLKGDRESLLLGMEENAVHFPNKEYEIIRVVEEGDLIVSHARLRLSSGMPEIAVIHIYRFVDDKIVEEWDLAQQSPDEMPNENGLF
jgi:predicted SnoaL-like aldol condensation-catalyzing enzyme